MRPSSSNPRGVFRGAVNDADGGFALLEFLSALAIVSLALVSIHLIVSVAVRSRLRADSWMTNQHQGRLVTAWIADRARQAGVEIDPASDVARCRDAIVAQDAAYLPTTSRLFVNADVDSDGVAETRGFQVEVRDGVPAVTETVIACAPGAIPAVEELTDITSAEIDSLTFAYYDAAGAAVTNLGSASAIRTIRQVTVTIVVRADAGPVEAKEDSWTTHIALRNP